ncbi:MAG: hotdog fold thioesterase [Dehalococcoidia bacterium]|nr:hotdog fold thioesterase [Dehalococcoidia bacterium]
MTALALPVPGTPPAEAAAFWDAQPLFAALGIRVEVLEEGHAGLVMDRNGTNVAGVRDSINGGALATFAELAAHLCLRTVIEDGARLAGTQDLGISYLTSAVGERTVAEARVLRIGRLAVVDVTISDGADGRLNCRARVTCALERDGATS